MNCFKKEKISSHLSDIDSKEFMNPYRDCTKEPLRKDKYQRLDKVDAFSKVVVNKKRENWHLVHKNFNFDKLNISGEEFCDDRKYRNFEKHFLKIASKLIDEQIQKLGNECNE